MGSNDVQLLYVWASPFSMRAEVALLLKGVSYTHSAQDLSNKSPLLLQSNPVYKKIPVLIHDGKPVCESLIIVQYVDEAFPSRDGHDLLPKDPYNKAIARFWGDFVDRKIFDKFFEVIRKTGDEQQAAKTELKDNLNTLEEAFKTVPQEPPYFGGAKPGYVDVIMSPLISWYEAVETVGNFQFDFEKLPRLDAWMKAMRESPCGEILPEHTKITEFFSAMVKKRREAAEAEAKAKAQT